MIEKNKNGLISFIYGRLKEDFNKISNIKKLRERTKSYKYFILSFDSVP